MAADRTPWRDIFSLEVWLQILKLTAADPKRARSGATIDPLTQLIAKYQMIDKRDATRLEERCQALKTIADAAALHIANSGAVDAKDQKSAYDRGGDTNKRHKVQIIPGGNIGAKTNLIDPWISSLGKRAMKKRAYIGQIQQPPNSTEATNSARDFIAYLKEQVRRDRSGDLLPLTAGTKMEKIDPLHRDFEFHADPDGNITDPATAMARALQDWIAKGPDIPFFYWLEGHSICTASKHFDDTSKVDRVNYAGNSDAEVLRVWLQGSRLHSRGLLDDDGGGAFSTEGFGTKPGHAFVWLKDGTLVSHVHRAGEFHHSSFGGGKKVRCAGTWIVKNGLITMMDNNSGHYQPSDGHFLTLLQFFEKAGATDASTKVGTHSTVKGFGAMGAQADYIKVADYYQKVQGRATFRYDNANLTRGD